MDSPVFLQTKLHPSQIAARSLSRARLLRELKRDPSPRLVLVSGPAGSGKSTLLADFISQRARKAAWLGLGEEDQDPQVFLNYFLEALCRAAPGSAEQTRNRFGSSSGLTDPTQLGTFLINELMEYGDPVAIVLDDYHLIDAQKSINAFFKLLLKRGPSNLTVLITSRETPDLPLAWLRAKRLMTEIQPDTLRFTVDEADELFRTVWCQPLEPELVRLLVDRTEGWATGLQLVAQALRLRAPSETRRYIEHLRGAEASIFEYLASEVFEAQPARAKEFLKLTALPDCFNPELAQELVPACEAFEMIAHLSNIRLFLIRLDREGEWYRYHHLFRDFLRSKLNVDSGHKVVQSLHQTLGTWLLNHDDTVAAVPHFLSCGDSELAADVLERVGSELLHRGLRTSVARWVEGLPSRLRTRRPGMLVLEGELADLQGHWPRAVEGYRAALRIYRADGDAAAAASTLEKLSLCYLKYGESKQLLETCEEGLRLCPPDNPALRSMLESWLGATLINGGVDWERGYRLLRSSHTGAFETNDPRAISWACLTYGFAYHFPQGNFGEALRTLNEGIDFFTRLGWPMVLYQLTMNKAVVLILKGDPKTGMDLVEATMLDAMRAGHHYVEQGLETLRAIGYMESRCYEECRATLDKVARGEIAAQFKPWFYRTRMLLHCSERNFGQARVDAEEMERALLLSGAGMYAPECFVSLAYFLLQLGDVEEAHHRLEMNLQLCRTANSKFWEMKSWQLLAWSHYTAGDTVRLRQALGRALELTLTNDYGDHWTNNPVQLSVPLLVCALAYDVEATAAQRMLATLADHWEDCLEELMQHSDARVRKVAIRFVPGHSSKESVKTLLKQVYRNDPDLEVRETARRTLKLPDNASRLEIFCMGRLRVVVAGEEIEFAGLLRPLAQRLFKYFLVNADRIIASDRLLEAFWPDWEPEKGRHNLATQLSSIRSKLKTPTLFPRQGEGYRLYSQQGDVALDVLELERLCKQGIELLRAGEDKEAVILLRQAEVLYAGDFLVEDLYDDHIEWRRRELRVLFQDSIEALGDHFWARGQKEQALSSYRRILDPDEPQERIFQKVFRCYAELGDRQGAHKEYEQFKMRLKESMGFEPHPASRDLMAKLYLKPDVA